MSGENDALERPAEFDPESFYSHGDGETLVGPADLEAIVPDVEKPYLDEVERYWLNKPYSFAIIYHSRRENEKRYYVVEPHIADKEQRLLSLLDEQVRIDIDYEGISTETTREQRIELIQDTARELLRRWNLISRVDLRPEEASMVDRVAHGVVTFLEDRAERRREEGEESIRSAPVFRDEEGERTTLSPRQIDKLTYYLVRNFVGYERIDPLKHDINIEDISCDSPNTELFIYHSKYEQLLTNIEFSERELDSYVKRLANASGKGISRRQPTVDTTLPDGSRAQLTLAEEITTKGSNFTIRQFLDIPYTPVDLINWRTFSLDQMAHLWLCIEHNRSVIFAGGTASGKTTTQNAVSLFIPSNSKIVSIEDTPELELPQKNWIASITRQSFTKGGMGAIDEYDLLENSLRQRPNYIIMGEVRGEEGRTLFQAMASGHTTFTTFHANNASQVVQRFTTDPINVKKPYFDVLDLIVMQQETRVDGTKVRRSRTLTEVGEYESGADAVRMNDLYRWDASTDEFRRSGSSTVLRDIRQENGWSDDRLDEELQKRKIVLAYLIMNGISSYAHVAGTVQGFMMDDEAILSLIANDELGRYLPNLQNISSLDIDVDPEREDLIPRPEAPDRVRNQAKTTLDRAESLLAEYEGADVGAAFSELEIASKTGMEAETEAESGHSEWEIETQTSGEDDTETLGGRDQQPEQDESTSEEGQ